MNADPLNDPIPEFAPVVQAAVLRARSRGDSLVNELDLLGALLAEQGPANLLEQIGVDVGALSRRVDLRAGFQPAHAAQAPDGSPYSASGVAEAINTAAEAAVLAGRAGGATDILEMMMHLPPGEARFLLEEAGADTDSLVAVRGDSALGPSCAAPRAHPHLSRRVAVTCIYLPLLVLDQVLVRIALWPAVACVGSVYRVSAAVVGGVVESTYTSVGLPSHEVLVTGRFRRGRHVTAHLAARLFLLASGVALLVPTGVKYAAVHESVPVFVEAVKIAAQFQDGALPSLLMSIVLLPFRELLYLWLGLAFVYASMPSTAFLEVLRHELRRPAERGILGWTLVGRILLTPVWLIGRGCDSLSRRAMILRGWRVGPAAVVSVGVCAIVWLTLGRYGT